MMKKKIKFSKQFIKAYKKLIQSNIRLQKRIDNRIKLFIENRYSPELRDHALKGKMVSYRSFSITGDVRIIYKERRDSDTITFIFLDIGTHSQVY